MISASIVGATGYVGEELVRILSGHEYTKIVSVTSQNYIGQKIQDVFPNLNKKIDLCCEELNIKKIGEESDIIFLSLPHGHSAAFTKDLLPYSKKVIDMGADFRFDSKDVYEEWYKVEHKAPELIEEAVYGLPELNKSKIKESKIIGNPGCYPTSIILGLAPVLTSGIVEGDSIISDSKSGISGAGRAASVGNLFSEIYGNTKAYNIAQHRHVPEINQELSKLFNSEVSITFSPHVVPQSRGILSTIYCKLKGSHSLEEILSLYNDFYKDSLFVRVMDKGVLPQTKWVCGSNYCDIGLALDKKNNRLVIVSAIDNLVKGAAGQAVQNMNIMFGLPEDTGLKAPALYL